MQWAWNVVIARSVPYMILRLGYGTYIFFGSFCVLSFFWVLFFLPGTCFDAVRKSSLTEPTETKGIPLEEIDQLFGGKLQRQTRVAEANGIKREDSHVDYAKV